MEAFRLAHPRAHPGGNDPNIVFEHPGRETFGASVYVTRKGGTIVTRASTSGYEHRHDNRYLWMSLKRIVGSHFANYREAWQANRLVTKAQIHPTLSGVYPLAETGQAARDVQLNADQGKVGVLRLAPYEGLGVRDHPRREAHLPEINRSRGLGVETPTRQRRSGAHQGPVRGGHNVDIKHACIHTTVGGLRKDLCNGARDVRGE